MRLVTLVENVVYNAQLSAEHGFSLLIEYGGHRILFDTGQGDRFLKNAEVLGIDISLVDALVLSHGHYDHAGGLETFCRANKNARIYIKDGFFEPKFNKDRKFIGIHYSESLFSDRLITVKSQTEIFPGLYIMTDIPITNAWDTHFEDLYVQNEHGLELDRFSDEQFLVLKENGAISVVTGCAHRGISNIVRAAKSAFDLPIHLVLGGFHLSKSPDDMVDKLIRELSTFDIENLGCCHCTGVEKYARIKSFFGDRAFYNCTGTDYRSTDYASPGYAGADYKGPGSLR